MEFGREMRSLEAISSSLLISSLIFQRILMIGKTSSEEENGPSEEKIHIRLSDEGGKGEFMLKIPKQRLKVDPSGATNFTIRQRLIQFASSCLALYCLLAQDQGVFFFV